MCVSKIFAEEHMLVIDAGLYCFLCIGHLKKNTCYDRPAWPYNKVPGFVDMKGICSFHFNLNGQTSNVSLEGALAYIEQ